MIDPTLRTRVGLVLALLLVLAAPFGGHLSRAQSGSSDGWQIPPTAMSESNPIPRSDQVVAKGKQIYRSKCQRCHGVAGKGDGPDADPDHRPDDLTDAGRAARNPDGVIFYKVWNGRKKPKMPAFSADLGRDEVWTVVHYVKTLRQ
jgi:mono/diheme cytochrome c family protein